MYLRDDAVKWMLVCTDRYYCKHTRTESNFLRHSGIITHGDRWKGGDTLVSISSDMLINPPLPNIIRHVDPQFQLDFGHS